MTKEKAAEAIRNTIEPYFNAINTLNAEAERLRHTTVDGINQTIDTTHRLAKEGLAAINTLNDMAYKQFTAQLQRTVEFVTAFAP